MYDIEEIGRGTFYTGDCVSVMRDLPAASVDMVVTSPPYDNLRTYNDGDAWTWQVFEKVAAQLVRVLRPGGVIVWNVSDATIKGSETGTSFRQVLWFKDAGLNIHDTMIWVKDGGGAIGSSLSYTQNFEYMFVLSKGRPSNVNLLYDKPNLSAGKNKSGVGRRNRDGSHKTELRKTSAAFSRRNNWWYIPPARGEHPAVFPVSLPQDHIATWSEPGAVVLDPFGGSGTTAVAAENTGRRWICIERDPDYASNAIDRIQSHVGQSTIETPEVQWPLKWTPEMVLLWFATEI